MRTIAALLRILVCAPLLVACEEATSEEVLPLVDDPSAVIAVEVRQTEEPEAGQDTEPVAIYSSSGVLVGYADASPRVVPIAWGERSADPATDYMLVTVQVEPAFVDRLTQVELNIAVGDAAGSTWCEPMKLDGVTEGIFYLHLQPACDQQDPLTDGCVIDSSSRCADSSGICREDLLTFTLWDDISSDCHSRQD